ncbi:carboxymuconolactone decarboxylase family protein [Devosia sp.]|uniref:carboxymuconolactone decarboxylase family protein n=1 Tax=Devosia sp. TaxID=1871048 RepID=UPI003BAB8338
MPRIPTPPTIAAAPAAAQPFLEAVKKQIGSAPNLFRITATSPAALEGYLGLNGALAKGALNAATSERIALAVAQINGCGYCLAAHSYIGSNVARLSDAELIANRSGRSEDPKANAAVAFAVAVAKDRGAITDADFSLVRAAGYSDAEIVEIVAHVALNTLTNYINEVFQTEVDFPVVPVMLAA